MTREKSKRRTELDPKELEKALEKLPIAVTAKLAGTARRYQKEIEKILDKNSE